jgi:hypothetical protein
MSNQKPFILLDKLAKGEYLNVLIKEYTIDEFGLKDLNISSRQLSHWLEMGILPDKKRIQDENHKFNFVEFIWLKIVIELREFGFSISKIKIAKLAILKSMTLAELSQYPNTKTGIQKAKNDFSIADSDSVTIDNIFKKQIPFLSLFVMDCIKNREDVKIYVSKNGQTVPYSLSMHALYQGIETHLNGDSFIVIPLISLLKEFVEEERYFNFSSRAKILSDSEQQILELIRNGKAKSITISFKNDQPELIEVKKYKNVMKETRLSEIILKKGYEKIEVTTESGNIAYTTVTTKYKLK